MKIENYWRKNIINTIVNNVSLKTEPAAIKVWVEERTIFIELTDGRIVGFPADRFKILKKATVEHRENNTLTTNYQRASHG